MVAEIFYSPLGFGNAATKNVGTTPGTVADGGAVAAAQAAAVALAAADASAKAAAAQAAAITAAAADATAKTIGKANTSDLLDVAAGKLDTTGGVLTGPLTTPSAVLSGTGSAPGFLDGPAFAAYRGVTRLQLSPSYTCGGWIAGLDLSSVYPLIEPGVFVSATITAGQKSFVVADASRLRIGMEIASNYFPSLTRIAAISGATITASNAATSSGTPSALQFGRGRWDISSNIAANVIAGRAVYGGAASYGNSTYIGGSVDIFDQGAAPAGMFLSPNGRYGIVSATRTQDNSSGVYGQTISDIAFAYSDNLSITSDVWARYTEVHVLAGAKTGQTFGEESSIANLGPEVAVDPYTSSIAGQTTNLRLDSGVANAASNAVSCALDVVPNGAKYLTGINVAYGALSTAATTTPSFLQLPQNYAISWHSAAGTSGKRWALYSSAASGSNTADLAADGLRLSAGVYAGGATNSIGTDQAIGVRGATSAGLAIQVDGNAALGVFSGVGYSAIIDSRPTDLSIGTNGATGLQLHADKSATFKGGVGFNDATPVGKQTLPAAATDAASTMTLANALRAALIALGLAQ